MKVSNQQGRELLKKKKPGNKNEESKMQQALVKWFRMQYPQYAKLLTAIPNGGNRDVITGAILKAEGVLAGWPDLMLAVPKNKFSGLFLELKVAKGTIAANQREIISELRGQGYAAYVCFGLESARDRILWYLERQPEEG